MSHKSLHWLLFCCIVCMSKMPLCSQNTVSITYRRPHNLEFLLLWRTGVFPFHDGAFCVWGMVMNTSSDECSQEIYHWKNYRAQASHCFVMSPIGAQDTQHAHRLLNPKSWISVPMQLIEVVLHFIHHNKFTAADYIFYECAVVGTSFKIFQMTPTPQNSVHHFVTFHLLLISLP
jgi:hypothetical protein